ncbi:DUF4445 domain-containing protein [Dissulfurirhabdus thermomarina]|uniref:DUF4445 domain-containing protein n=1 Tax=Dissulfurirhabdus thermomarina TaxID=1765737 RepID=A0A6N9TSC6_DISTH|nr:ASKHA domain-containing protein [Dissulfurirhabdus thermomarina]NDY42654.1 DUF4445 domain-containing protein [Dissulfurirhabdus thermomarina]NMX23106.1 DUF4445 domain-containing protein [Dissulfurirhabdus thermomarina]
MPKVTFLPSGVEVDVPPGENLLRAAMLAGLHVNASCGGAGVCNKCKVLLEAGEARGERLPDGGWKACATVPAGDVQVRIPVESEMDRRALARPRRAAAWIQAGEGRAEWPVAPLVQKTFLTLPAPTPQDNVSDLYRLRRELAQGELADVALEVDPPVLYTLAETLRADDWRVTVSLRGHLGVPAPPRLIRVEAGDTTGAHAAVAVDIGTTTVSAELVDLATGAVLAEVSDYNPQVSYGEDVISRMEFARKGDGLAVLQRKVVERLNGLVRELFQQAELSPDRLSLITVGANSVMTHFLLGLDPRHLRMKPYTPVANHFPAFRGRDIGLHVAPHVRVYLAPCVASYVGGDIVAGVVGVGLQREEALTLFIDIGTNGEIVLGNRDWMACAACSAGPAFEGGGIRHGMRATTGAVELVHVHPETHEPMVLTIGGRRAKGICGSGIISLLAGLFTSGAVDPQGKFRRDLATPRIREGRDGWEYVVVEAEATATGEDIVFTEVDIENLIRAKGAMFAGYLTLLESVGMTFEDLDRVVLAGNFGSYLDLEQAITIGLLPDIPRERFFFAGNASLLGARSAAVSREAAAEQHRVAQMMTHFDLSDNPQFMQHYMSSLFLPHTDAALFPSVGGGAA